MTAVEEIIDDLPKGWNVSAIGDIADIKYGKSNPRTTGKIPLIGSSGIFGMVEESLIDIPTIVVGRKGTAGSVQLVSMPSYPSDTTFYLVFNEKKPDLQFLYYFMSLYKLSGEHAKTTVPSIQKGDLENYKFPFPPFEEQKKIASVLLALQEAKEKTENVLASLKELKKSMMKHLFTYGAVPIEEIGSVKLKETEIGLMSDAWDVAKLSSLPALIQTGPFGSQLHASDYIKSGLPVINPTNINEGRIFPDFDCCISKEKAASLSRHILCKRDIVFGRRGEMGRSAIVKEDGYFCGTGSLLLRFDAKEIDSEFVSYYLRTEPVHDWLLAESVGTTMNNLNTQILGRLPIPVPSLKVQSSIVSTLTAVEDKIFSEENKKNSLDALFKTLLSLLMTGKVRVNNLEI